MRPGARDLELGRRLAWRYRPGYGGAQLEYHRAPRSSITVAGDFVEVFMSVRGLCVVFLHAAADVHVCEVPEMLLWYACG